MWDDILGEEKEDFKPPKEVDFAPDYNKVELRKRPFGGCCPACGARVKYYDTAKDGNSGRYKCPACGRDTSWLAIPKTKINLNKGMSKEDKINQTKKAKDNTP